MSLDEWKSRSLWAFNDFSHKNKSGVSLENCDEKNCFAMGEKLPIFWGADFQQHYLV